MTRPAEGATATSTATDPASTGAMSLLAFSSTAGVLVEFYDFFLYGYAASTAFPKTFFPGLSPTLALVFSFLTFGAGFPARVLGAFIFGHFGDRTSRKYSFLINILIAGFATFVTGLLPGYATIGLAAPVILVLLRIVQGIGLGGEFGGASSLLAEFGAHRKHRAFWVSLSNLGIPLGAMAGSGVLLLFSGSFTTTGWRIAMMLSAVIVAPALLARYKLADSPLFDRVKRTDRLARMPTFNVFKQHARPIILLALFAAFQQMDGYVSGTYIISFMGSAGIPLAMTAAIILIARFGDVLGIVASGPFANILRRKTVGYAAVVLTTLLSVPFVLAILSKNLVLTIILQFLVTLLGVGLLHGLAPVLNSESFPTRFRYSGAGISYNLSAVAGGMLAPSILAGLIGQDAIGRWYFIPLTYGMYCLVAVVALTFIRETKDVALEDLDRE
ncbi:MAG TPA: MFS transporter [Streptosporangiales bacterium]